MRIISTWRKQRISKKKLKRLRKEKRARSLTEMAQSLNKAPPKSEIWFHSKFSLESIPRLRGIYKKCKCLDIKNEPFFDQYIPDVVNHGYRYIIEVDGSIHDTLKQAYKDLAKDNYYKKRHYKVFRVKAYDEESYNEFIKEFKLYIELCHATTLSFVFNLVTESGGRYNHMNRTVMELITTTPEFKIFTKERPKTILRRKSS